ncbi:MAG: FAD-containing monooxygenase EthA, partial [Acidobacteriota bacterium]
MAAQAAHVTMLQRSPAYIFSLPAVDIVARWLKRLLPLRLAYGLTRWKNIVLQMISFNLLRRFPTFARRRLTSLVREQLGPDFDLETHFSPRYNPWDERLCVVPDNDLFAAIRTGKVDVVTDQIETLNPTGLRLASGRQLEADIIVTATVLELQFAGGASITVDGQPIDTGQVVLYKGALFSGVPNFLLIFGYTNASWTLRADLLAEYFCRVINFMNRHGYVEVRPPLPDRSIALRPAADLKSGYFKRADAILPRQGDRGPWRNPQNYAFDIFRFRFGAIRGEGLRFR